jgi:hypothetical protein
MRSWFLAKFQEHTTGARWVKEADQHPFCPGARHCVDSFKTILNEGRNRSRYTGHTECDVMNTLSMFLNEPGYRTFRMRAFEKFNLGFPDPEKSGLYSLIVHLFHAVAWNTEQPLIECYGIVKVFYRDTDVFNMCRRHFSAHSVHSDVKARKLRVLVAYFTFPVSQYCSKTISKGSSRSATEYLHYGTPSFGEKSGCGRRM